MSCENRPFTNPRLIPRQRESAVAIQELIRPFAKKFIHESVHPGPASKWLFKGLFDADWYGREVYEWARRSLWATPLFLGRCESYGERITCDRLPYINGPVKIRLGDDIRFSGKLDIYSSNYSDPVLEIGNGVFIGHGCRIAIADNIQIHDYVSIGALSFIADTEGHSHYNPMKPIWEIPASDEDIKPVIIENNVQIAGNVAILKGVTIGARSVIGTGAVVRSNIPPDSIVMGNPGRVVKRMKAPEEEAA